MTRNWSKLGALALLATWGGTGLGCGEGGESGVGSGADGSGASTGDGPLGDGLGSGASDGAGGSGSGTNGSGGVGEFPTAPPTADCEELVTNPSIGWRNGALGTDQEIVECLWSTLGRPVGYGQDAHGGFDPNGQSQLVVIDADLPTSIEQQLLDAIAGEEHRWIVFDKDDFAEPVEIGLYRAFCEDAAVLTALGGTAEQCRDYESWCSAKGHGAGDACLEQFFNVALNDGDLPIRNPVIGSNKTIDGRLSQAYFLFSGFAIGRDSSGTPTQTAKSVILTHLDFVGAGHTEDHELDPDMIRSTGASEDIWIHKNTFDTTGDSAFDVKVGAFDITISFNRVVDVLRATLHGSSDSHTIDTQITTTLHHNAFVTRDASYLTLGNTGRRVPLIRHGKSHLWNNLFVNYRKDVLSIRVGASVLHEDNAFVVSESLMEKSTAEASLAELSANLIRDIDGGNYRTSGNLLWFSSSSCVVDGSTETALSAASGTVGDLAASYGAASQSTLAEVRLPAGQELIDYVSATAGKDGALPFNSPLAQSVEEVLAAQRVACQ